MCSFLIFWSFTTYCTFAARCTVNIEEKKILSTIKKMLDKKLELFESMQEKKRGPIVKRLDNMQCHIAKIQDIEKSISFLRDKFNETAGRIARLEEENETLRNENQCLRAEVYRTTNLITQLKDDANNLQQYSCRDCLEIRGLPVLEEEGLAKISASQSWGPWFDSRPGRGLIIWVTFYPAKVHSAFHPSAVGKMSTSIHGLIWSGCHLCLYMLPVCWG